MYTVCTYSLTLQWFTSPSLNSLVSCPSTNIHKLIYASKWLGLNALKMDHRWLYWWQRVTRSLSMGLAHQQFKSLNLRQQPQSFCKTIPGKFWWLAVWVLSLGHHHPTHLLVSSSAASDAHWKKNGILTTSEPALSAVSRMVTQEVDVDSIALFTWGRTGWHSHPSCKYRAHQRARCLTDIISSWAETNFGENFVIWNSRI
jgi:hypothetical protein